MQTTSIILGIAIPLFIAFAMILLPANLISRRAKKAEHRIVVESVDIRALERQLVEQQESSTPHGVVYHSGPLVRS